VINKDRGEEVCGYTMIRAKSQEALARFKTDFRKYFDQWHNHWAHCIKSQGDTLKETI
jgi:hypothetical protein